MMKNLRVKLRGVAPIVAVAAALVTGVVVAPAASGMTLGGAQPQGMNVCHTEYRTKNTPICWLTPSNPACRYAVQVCTRY